MTTSPQEPGAELPSEDPNEPPIDETPSDRLDPEIPNPDVPVDDSGDPAAVPNDPDVDPIADHGTADEPTE